MRYDHISNGAVMVAPMVNPFEPSMTKKERYRSWGWIRDKKHQQNKNIHLFIYHVGDTEASQYSLKHIISISVANNGRAVAQCHVCS
ncbi:hypothetical protein LOK49_Contig338G00003 [Camellia lanceoleosa]|nr:hypothetical protein LOK49_Contig338G00003 [Camellia lanceoleosa]